MITRELPSLAVWIESRPGADPVERRNSVKSRPSDAVGADHAVHQLLGAGVDPALLVDRAVDQVGCFRVELVVAAHAVHFGRRREEQALAVLARAARTIGRLASKSSSNTRSGSLHVGGGRGDRDQRQDHVALLDVVLDPLLVDRDVAFEEVQARIVASRSSMRSDCMSMPNTSQSVVSRMRCDR